MINLFTRLFSIETAWTLYGDSVETNNFYGESIVKLVWRKHGKSNYQTISMSILPY